MMFWAMVVLVFASVLFVEWWVSASNSFLPELQRFRKGIPCCHHCGYDLTGNVSGVCPECGSSVPRLPLVESEAQ